MTPVKRSGIAVFALSLFLLTAVAVALAGEKIDEKRKVDANATIKISNVSGSVSVSAWDRKEVHVTGTLGEGAKELRIEGDGRHLTIKVELPDNARNVEETHLTVRVPQGCTLDVSTVSADIGVEGVEGTIRLDSVSGDIESEGKPKGVEVNTVSGEIELSVQTERVSANSVSGDIRVEDSRGELDLETVSGDCWAAGDKFERVRFKSVSGDLHFDGGLDKNGSYAFTTHSGEVELVLPGGIDAAFEVNTFSGDIHNVFGEDGRRRSKHGPGEELSFTVGSGGADVRIETFSGDVMIERR